MLEGKAAACADNRPQCCRRRPSAPLPPFTPAALSPVGPQTSLCEGHRLHRRDPGLAGPLPHHPSPRHNPNTFRSHPPHTAPLCAPNMRPPDPHLHQKRKRKRQPCSPGCLAAAQRSGRHLLTSCSQRTRTLHPFHLRGGQNVCQCNKRSCVKKKKNFTTKNVKKKRN